MSESVSPCIAEGLERIQTGWRIEYTSFGDFMIYHADRKEPAFVCPTIDAARRNYRRLTEKREKGK